MLQNNSGVISSYQNNSKLSFINEDKESLSFSKMNSIRKNSEDKTPFGSQSSNSKQRWYQPSAPEQSQVEVNH